MGWPPEKFDRAFDEVIEKMERVKSYSKTQDDFGFPVATRKVTKELEEIYLRLVEIRGL